VPQFTKLSIFAALSLVHTSPASGRDFWWNGRCTDPATWTPGPDVHRSLSCKSCNALSVFVCVHCSLAGL